MTTNPSLGLKSRYKYTVTLWITSPFKVYDPIDLVSTSNSQGVMKWSKREKGLTEKGEFGPHALPISGRFPKEWVSLGLGRSVETPNRFLP